MAKRYRPVPRDQAFLLPPDMRGWLPPGHPAWLVITVVERHLDTAVVHATRRAGGAGAAGYDPDMLTALLVRAYANRVTSSRRIEALCRTGIAFRVICAGQVPDHVTIARFRAGPGTAAAGLFDQVLALCARLGMGRLGLVALDGMKIAASASKSANRGREKLRELAGQIAAEHAATDAAEDELFGPGVRGDEVPAELADPRTRSERIAAALAELEAEEKAARASSASRDGQRATSVRAGGDDRLRRSGRRRPGSGWTVPSPGRKPPSPAGRPVTPRGRQRGGPGCAARRRPRPSAAAGSRGHAPRWNRPARPGSPRAGRARLRRSCVISPIRTRG